MNASSLKSKRRLRRKRQIRRKLVGTTERPRLTVFRSNKQIYAQIIDDLSGKTLASACSLKLDKGWGQGAAAEVGRLLAQQAHTAGVEKVAFDRNGFRFHGRVKALAVAAEEAGLQLANPDKKKKEAATADAAGNE